MTQAGKGKKVHIPYHRGHQESSLTPVEENSSRDIRIRPDVSEQLESSLWVQTEASSAYISGLVFRVAC